MALTKQDLYRYAIYSDETKLRNDIFANLELIYAAAEISKTDLHDISERLIPFPERKELFDYFYLKAS
jgi:hypothetical protein